MARTTDASGNTVSLADKAMLVSLNISSWQGRKQDKKATAQVQLDTGGKEGSGRYNKLIVPKEALATIGKTISAARTYHYDNTLPWNDNGYRILPSTNFLPYTEGMRKLRTDFEKAVMEFVGNYPQYIQEGKDLLGTLYDINDYPSVNRIQTRFSFEVAVDPLPQAEDFRVALQSAEVEAIQEQITARVKAAQEVATQDLYRRLHEVLSKVEERLSNPEAIFRDSLIDNVAEVTELIPRLNITGDRTLQRTVNLINDKIVNLDPDNLRTNLVERKTAAADAKALLDKMAGYCGFD